MIVLYRTRLIGIAFFFFISGIAIGLFGYSLGSRVSEETVRRLLASCTQNSGSEYVSCLRHQFGRIVRPSNLKDVMVAIEVYSRRGEIPSGEESSPECHALEHVVGEIAASRHQASPAYLMNSCGRSCGYGCAHGVIVGILKRDPSIIDDPEKICSSRGLYSMTNSESIACYHGIGHALAEYTGYALASSLAYCGSFGDIGAQEECWTGVFMEIYTPLTAGRVPQPLPQDALSFCSPFELPVRNFCIRQIAAAKYKVTEDIHEAFNLCPSLPSSERVFCVATLGADAYFVEKANPQRIIHACSQTMHFMSKCIEGAITSSLVIDATGRQGMVICQESPKHMQESCTASLQEQKEMMNRESK